jgi:hypothetical protein
MAGKSRRPAWLPAGTKAAPQHRERSLQADCIQLFNAGRGHRIAILNAVPNGEKRDKITAGILSGISEENRRALPEDDLFAPFGQGVIPGVEDLQLKAPGPRICLIELKTEDDETWGLKGGTLGWFQRRYRIRMIAMGFDYQVVRNTTEFWDLCAAYGVKLLISRPWHPSHARPAPAAPAPVATQKPPAPISRTRRPRAAKTPPAAGAEDPQARQRWDVRS